MKIVPLSEAKAKLSRYAQLCQAEPIVVTVNGRPSFQLVPFKGDDDLVDQLIERHPGFGEMLKRRLEEPSLSAARAMQRLSPVAKKRREQR